MEMMGEHSSPGKPSQKALKRARQSESLGLHLQYDMLGTKRRMNDARNAHHYFSDYEQAISRDRQVRQRAQRLRPPWYLDQALAYIALFLAQADRVPLRSCFPKVRTLALLGKKLQYRAQIDAERS